MSRLYLIAAGVALLASTYMLGYSSHPSTVRRRPSVPSVPAINQKNTHQNDKQDQGQDEDQEDNDDPDVILSHPDQFITLSRGRVRYRVYSPSSSSSSSSSSLSSSSSSSSSSLSLTSFSSKLLVLVHGFSTPLEIYHKLAIILAQAGWCVLTFDNYGRGHSDSPIIKHDGPLYVAQVAELLLALNVKCPVNICGVSMGGAIVTLFAHTYPQLVRRLILLCPAGLKVNSPAVRYLLHVPLLGEALVNTIGAGMFISASGKSWEFPSSSLCRAFMSLSRRLVSSHAGYLRALHRTIVDFPMDSLQREIREIGERVREQKDNIEKKKRREGEGEEQEQEQAPLKILIIWGTKDSVIPFGNTAAYRSLLSLDSLTGDLVIELLEGAEHMFVVERSKETAKIILSFMNQ